MLVWPSSFSVNQGQDGRIVGIGQRCVKQSLGVPFFFSVAQITGGEAFISDTAVYDRWNGASFTADVGGESGRLFLASITARGVSILGTIFDPLFDSSLVVGPGFTGGGNPGSFLLARVDFDIVGEGTTEFSFTLGDQGVSQLHNIILTPTFGSATLEVSSPVLLGDVDRNGTVDFLDIFRFIEVLSTPVYQSEADMDQNQECNFFDIPLFTAALIAASSGN